ncbi:AMP-binding protein [Nocardia rhamnosiphila]|uniref:AMP-binding protein n=1 Tax=Nocardia rhamnosiphila TaxID=426716 RepID=A0ABV2WYR6_9NOCA
MPPPTDPLLISGYLQRAAERNPAAPAVSDRTRRLTYAELDAEVTRLADELARLGVGRGDRVALLMQNSIEMAVSLLAPLRIGAIASPINIRLTPSEIRYILDDLEATAVIADAGHVATVIGEPLESLRGLVVVGANEAQPVVATAGGRIATARYEVGALEGGMSRPDVELDPRDAAYILYTSGTTGRPKGAVLSHAGYVAGTVAVLHALRMSATDELRHINVPMFHSGGLNSLLQQVVLGGPALITEPGGLRPEELVDLWEQHEVFTAFLTPTQWQQVCDLPGLSDRKLRLGRLVWGSSSPPPSLLRQMQDLFPGLPIYASFGMTETSGTTCSLPPEYAVSKAETVGRPVGPIQVRVVDSEMRDVPQGGVGEIIYQGPALLREYWRNESATEEAFAGGWFHSGDLGSFDEDGFLSVVGRLKEMIISGGENIYNSEVEAAVGSHPKVAQVVVVGVSHPKWVETPCAVIVPENPADPPSLAEIHEHVASILASYKKPTAIEIVPELPRNAMGKLLRSKVKADLVARQGGRT